MFVQESLGTGCVSGCSQVASRSPQDEAILMSRVSHPRWKRVLDLTLILLFLPVWLPVMLVIAMGIKLVSRGPVIFRQERIGHQGRAFPCLKFRSMRCDVDVQSHKAHLEQLMNTDQPMVKLDQKNDPRLIPFGRLLRASSLDELPQLFNVLHGDMSLVGPRPCIPYEYEQHQPWQKERFAVLPGMTGLWQVTGKNKTTFEQMVRLDIRYGKNLSLWQDLRIILKTFLVVAQQLRESVSNKMETAHSLLSKNRT